MASMVSTILTDNKARRIFYKEGKMFMKKKLFIALFAVVIISIITGCSNSEFKDNYKKFNESYLLATNFVGKGNNTVERLQAIDENLIKNELVKMKEYIDFMDSTKKAKEENLLYSNSKNYYQDIIELLQIVESINNYNNVSEEEELKFVSAMSSIAVDIYLIKSSVY